MKAVILAAGYGTRLGELTRNKAKPLLPIGRKTIIGHIVEKLLNHNIDQIFVVTNNKFYSSFVEWKESFEYQNIKIINDGTNSNEERLGPIGDMNFAIQQENIDDDLLVIGGDNLFEDNLLFLMNHFNEKGSTILLNDIRCLEKAKLYGIVTLNETNRITKFTEKPENPESTLASTLIYTIKREHLYLINKALNEGFADRAGDFIKYLAERENVFGIPLSGNWFDIGSLESLREAEEHFRE